MDTFRLKNELKSGYDCFRLFPRKTDPISRNWLDFELETSATATTFESKTKMPCGIGLNFASSTVDKKPSRTICSTLSIERKVVLYWKLEYTYGGRNLCSCDVVRQNFFVEKSSFRDGYLSMQLRLLGEIWSSDKTILSTDRKYSRFHYLFCFLIKFLSTFKCTEIRTHYLCIMSLCLHPHMATTHTRTSGLYEVLPFYKIL